MTLGGVNDSKKQEVAPMYQLLERIIGPILKRRKKTCIVIIRRGK